MFLGKGIRTPSVRALARPAPPTQLRWQGERYKRGNKIPSVRPAVVQLPLLFNFVGKGSDTYQTRYRNTNENIVYIGWFVPPLERLERREEPEAQGGEFVEADDCK
ncbi:MAG: hypothetical protein CL920_19225 [Deltaproteobacteria bacterium]|nr:hypothetical protein [Deltaproteobacteria bacterium]